MGRGPQKLHPVGPQSVVVICQWGEAALRLPEFPALVSGSVLAPGPLGPQGEAVVEVAPRGSHRRG